MIMNTETIFIMAISVAALAMAAFALFRKPPGGGPPPPGSGGNLQVTHRKAA
jgi:hypothetical protein